jgi:AAA family ATP:ADP antiporter
MFMYIRTGRLALIEFPQIEARTRFFSQLDLWTNAAALALQLLVVGQIAKRIGGIAVLMIVGILAALSFVPIIFFPTLAVLAATNVMRRAMEFGFAKPARDMLYTVVDPETKYKAKNVIDTTLYRGADMTATWVHGLLAAAGLTLAGLCVLAAVLALLTTVIAIPVGKEYRALGGK